MMSVLKRNGMRETLSAQKLAARLRKLTWELSPTVDITYVTNKVSELAHSQTRRPTRLIVGNINIQVIGSVSATVTGDQLDELASQTAVSMITSHPDYGTLAARIQVSNLHRNTEKQFSSTIEKLYKQPSPMIDEKIYQLVLQHKEELDSAILYHRDYSYDYFGIKTLMKSYLFKIDSGIVERPQHMLMRVALGIHYEDIAGVIETYHLMSQKLFTHASPTLFNAATPRPQLSSCFLLTVKEDSIEGIYDTLKQCAVISKHAGGVGISVHNVRCKGSSVRGSNGTANGLVPMLRVFNNTARYVDQGGGKRKGSFAVYLEPWHSDVFEFLSLKKNHGKEEERCRDLFFALWIPDLFMHRVKNDELWSLMCPDLSPGLPDVYGDAFDALYVQYEQEGKYKRQIKARDLWSAILHSQMETGGPFMVYKDHCNKKSNQQNLGTLRGSNLCTEIVEYADKDEIAVCNLASIALPKFVNVEKQTFDFDRLIKVTGVVTRNLNKIIDINYYPLPECRKSNLRHRPIGIGVQGLADVFILLRMPFDSVEAKRLNRDIFEAIYYGAVKTSNELAISDGAYDTFEGSPASQGKLQFDLWNVAPNEDKYGWQQLKQSIMKHGLRNSLLTAPMPTASTSQILGNNECIEAYTSNVYLRRTLAGEFVVINKYLLTDLIELGIWSHELKTKLIANNGSVQLIDEIPSELKQIYKTVWEIKQKEVINMAVDRAPFIDQSQSLNIHMAEVNYSKLTSMHFYAWMNGLKTGMYYLRTQAAVDAIKFTVCPTQMQQIEQKKLHHQKKRRQLIQNQRNKIRVIKRGEDDDDMKEIELVQANEDDVSSEHTNKYEEGDATDLDDYKILDDNVKTRATKSLQPSIAFCSRYNKDDCISCGS